MRFTVDIDPNSEQGPAPRVEFDAASVNEVAGKVAAFMGAPDEEDPLAVGGTILITRVA